MLSKPATTAEGFEMTVGANHLGHFLLTSLLLDRLRDAGEARVVTVASSAPRRTRCRQGRLLPGRGLPGHARLLHVEAGQPAVRRELAKREKAAGSDVTSFAVHPGGVRSGFGLDGDTNPLMQIGIRLMAPLYISNSAGAGPSVYAASQPGLESQTGAYLQRTVAGNWGPVRSCSRRARRRTTTPPRHCGN